MYTDYYKRRVQEILDFITEITFGNYTYTLPLRNQKDELEQIVLGLNTMVEEVDTAVHQINYSKSKEVMENVIFNLNRDLQICSYSDNAGEILKYSKKELINKPIKLFIGEGTQLPADLSQLLKQAIAGDYAFNVEFRHRNGYNWNGKGYLHRLVSNDKICYTLSVFKAIHYNEKLINELRDHQKGAGYPSENRSLHRRDQRELIRELHKYVMERLDRKLQKIPIISREVGSSVSKIKAVFKQAYGDTLYNYHLSKRLEKSFMLLKETNLPVNEIAEECGFKNVSHFSRTFKKVYGLPPSEVRKS